MLVWWFLDITSLTAQSWCQNDYSVNSAVKTSLYNFLGKLSQHRILFTFTIINVCMLYFDSKIPYLIFLVCKLWNVIFQIIYKVQRTLYRSCNDIKCMHIYSIEWCLFMRPCCVRNSCWWINILKITMQIWLSRNVFFF